MELYYICQLTSQLIDLFCHNPLSAAWLLWPARVQAPAVRAPLQPAVAPGAAAPGEEGVTAPALREAPLTRVSVTPEEVLRGPDLAYVDDPEDLHNIQLQRIATLAPGRDAQNAILSFANAVMMAGNTWATTPAQMRYLRLNAGAPEAYIVENPHDLAEQEISSVALRPYELEAVELLQKGRGVVWSFEAYGLHAVGALRNTSRCRECHDQPDNALLGGMSYVFTEFADD